MPMDVVSVSSARGKDLDERHAKFARKHATLLSATVKEIERTRNGRTNEDLGSWLVRAGIWLWYDCMLYSRA